jgi:succinate dehydrogenase flavin-adding protein (antitoxin of CptAB toxin-antitoxin module)
MKNKALDDATNRAIREMNLATAHAEMVAQQRISRRDELERLAWEAKRAVADYQEALAAYEEDERNALNEQQQHAAAQAFEDEQTDTF